MSLRVPEAASRHFLAGLQSRIETAVVLYLHLPGQHRVYPVKRAIKHPLKPFFDGLSGNAAHLCKSSLLLSAQAICQNVHGTTYLDPGAP